MESRKALLLHLGIFDTNACVIPLWSGSGQSGSPSDCRRKFGGIGVSDTYAAYETLFNEHQLCWAHLLGKAIKLALEHPRQTEYAKFLDQLCEVAAFQ